MPRITQFLLATTFALLPLTAQMPGEKSASQPTDTPEQGQGRPGHRPRGPFARLKLTEQQHKEIRAIRGKHRAAIAEKRKAAHDAEKAYREALRKFTTPEADLRTLNQKMADARLAVTLEQRASTMACAALLTPEQKVEFEKFQAEHHPGNRGPGFKGYGPREGHRDGRRHEGRHRQGQPVNGQTPAPPAGTDAKSAQKTEKTPAK